MTTEVGGDRYGTGGIDRRKGVLTVEQAADYIFVSPRTLRRMLAARKISFLKIGTLVRLYQPESRQLPGGVGGRGSPLRVSAFGPTSPVSRTSFNTTDCGSSGASGIPCSESKL